MNVLHDLTPPSPWVVRWSGLLRPGASVLDVACGGGRHLAWFLDRSCVVNGIDRDIAAARNNAPGANLIEADIEQGPWPLLAEGQIRQFDAVIVTNYLWRSLMPTLLASLAPGGVLIYETFTAGNETVGRPSRSDFLLREGELLDLCRGLRVVGYENGFLEDPARFVQRIAAVKQTSMDGPGGMAVRYAL